MSRAMFLSLALVFASASLAAPGLQNVSQQVPMPDDGQAKASESDVFRPTPDPTSRSGFYVPKDLDDSLKELARMLPRSDIDKMRKGSMDDMVLYHHGLGTWMRNEWGLWGESRLKSYFTNLGVLHPDDMTLIVLEAYWCKLNDKAFDLQARISEIKEYWKQAPVPKGRQ